MLYVATHGMLTLGSLALERVPYNTATFHTVKNRAAQ